MTGNLLDNFVRAARILPRPHVARWLATIPLGVFSAVVESAAAAGVYALAAILNDPAGASDLPMVARLREALPSRWTGEADLLHAFLFFVTLVFALRVAIAFATAVYHQRVIAMDRAELAATLFHGYLRAPYPFHLHRNAADHAHRINHGVDAVFGAVLGGAASLVTNAVAAIGLVAVLFAVDPWGAPVGVAALVLWMVVATRVVRGGLVGLGREADEAVRSRHEILWRGLDTVRELQVLGRERHLAEAFAEAQRRVVAVYLRSGLLALAPRLLLETIFVFAMVMLSAMLLLREDQPAPIVPLLGLYAYVGVRLLPIANAMLAAAAGISGATEPLSYLCDDWKLVQDGLAEGEAEEPEPLVFADSIELDDVGYRYEGAVSDALVGVRLEIRKGEHVGIVGATGAGKSTLLGVLLGLLAPTSGRVRVDGAVLVGRERAWRRRVGFVPQSIQLIGASVRANVALGVPDADIDDEAVWRALELARLDHVVRGLADGLETAIGDRGIRLSGGQRQRLAVARALYASPDVLVFDEATSALDAWTEREVVEGLAAAAPGLTMIVVAHRLATVRRCGRIVVLESGRVEAMGTWEELAAGCPAFRRLGAGDTEGTP